MLDEHLLGELLEAQPLLGAQHLVAVHGVGELLHQRREPADDQPGLAELALARVAGGRGGVACLGGGRKGHGDPPARRLPRLDDQRGDARAALPRRTGGGRAAAGLALGTRLAAQGLGTARDRPGPLLGGPQRQPGLDLGGTCRLDGLGGRVADLGVGLVLDGLVLGHREPALRGLQREQGVGAAGLDLVATGAQALGLGRRRPDGLLVRPESRRGACAALFGGALLPPRRLDVGLAGGLLGAGAVESGVQSGDLVLDLGQRARSVVNRGLDVERAPSGPGSAGRPVWPDEVPVDGDGGEPGRNDQPRGIRIADQHDPVQQAPHRLGDGTVPGHRGRHPPRPRHHCARVIVGWARFRPFLAAFCTEPAIMVSGRDDEGGAARVAGTERAEGRQCGAEVGHGQSVGQLTQCRGDRRAGLGLHRDQRRHGAQHAVGPDERRRAVATRQPDRQRLHPRAPVRPLPLGLPLACHELGHPPTRALVRRARMCAALLEGSVAVGERAVLLPSAREVDVGRRGPFLRVGERVGQPLDLFRGGGSPAAQRVGSACEGREACAPVGERPNGREVRPLGRRQRALVLRPRFGDLRERAPRLHDRRDQPFLLLGYRVGLGVELVGVAARCARLGRGREVPRPFLGQPDGAREPLVQRGQAVPGVLRRREPWRVVGEGGLQPFLFDAGGGELGLDLGAPRPCARLVGLLLGELVAQRDEVVGEQPQPRVAQLGLHGLRPGGRSRPAARAGLSWRRSSAVRSVSRVRLACIASSLRSAFSLRLRCLRTPAASSMKARRSSGLRRQHRVELALPDDDVHLAADAGVGQQLLDVEQTAVAAVDLVLARAVAEHPPGDRHLGVVDGQRAVGVVDRERDLGAAERRPPRRCRRR